MPRGHCHRRCEPPDERADHPRPVRPSPRWSWPRHELLSARTGRKARIMPRLATIPPRTRRIIPPLARALRSLVIVFGPAGGIPPAELRRCVDNTYRLRSVAADILGLQP